MRILIVPADRTEPHGGARNLGDAFLTDALATALGALGHSASIYDFGPCDRRTSDLDRLRGGRARDLLRAIRGVDAVVLGGGTMLQDNCPEKWVGGLPRLCAVVSWAARASRRPVAFYGVGLDTIHRPAPRAVVRTAVAGRPVWVRDGDSWARFSQYFGREPSLAADASLLATTGILPSPSTSSSPSRVDDRHLTVALNREHAHQLSRDVLSAWANSYGSVSFLSMDQEPGRSDAASLPAGIAEVLGHRGQVLGWQEAAERVASSSTVLGSRMHALYLAAILGTPMVAVGSADKVRAFSREFGLPRVDSVADFRPGTERAPDPAALGEARARAVASLEDLVSYLEVAIGRGR